MTFALAARGKPGLLPTIAGEGFSATVNGFAWDYNNGQRQLYYLSMLGSQQAVRAVWANLLKGKRLNVNDIPPPAFRRWEGCTLAFSSQKVWKSYTKSLPNAAGHQLVMLPDIGRWSNDANEFLILSRSAAESPTLFYRFLDRRCELPLHPTWADWLWRRALAIGEATSLDSYGGLIGYRCHFELARLQSDITAAIRDRSLPIPVVSG